MVIKRLPYEILNVIGLKVGVTKGKTSSFLGTLGKDVYNARPDKPVMIIPAKLEVLCDIEYQKGDKFEKRSHICFEVLYFCIVDFYDRHSRFRGLCFWTRLYF